MGNFTLQQLPSFTFTHTSPQSFLNVGRSKKHEVQVLAEQIDLFTEAVTAKDHVVVDLTNKVINTYIQFPLSCSFVPEKGNYRSFLLSFSVEVPLGFA